MKTAAALALVLLTTALQAQPHREAITVEVVNVPVYVQRDNAPVEGLTREDFELLVNGKPVAIEYFDVIGDEATTSGGATTAAAAAAATPMRERRLFFFVFDIAFSRSYLIERARTAAVQFMKKAEPGDYFAVGTFAPRKGIQILVPFTSDVTAVQYAIKGAQGGEDPLRLVVPRDARAGMIAEVPGEAAEDFPTDASSKSASAGDEGASSVPQPGETRVQTDERLRQLNLVAQRPIIEEQIATLGELARRLAPLEGQKHVILLSEGWDVSSLERSGPGAAKLGWTGPYMTKLLDAMVKPFHESGIFLHSLDVTGLNLRGRASRQESLQQLATRTGGEYMHDRNDLRAAITDITHTYSSGYLLGFRPPAGVKTGFNKIAVRVKGEKGVKLRYRVGFDAHAPETNPIDALHLADVVLNDVPQTGVAPTLALSEGQFQARIPMDQLSAVLGKPARAELMVYVFDAKGAALHFQRQLFDVPMGATGILPVNFTLGLEPGTYTVKVLLRAGESLGFSKVKLNVKP